MKKFILFLMAALLWSANSWGYWDANVAKHGLEVKRLRNWAPKYLTVINNYDNLNFENAPNTLRFFSVITAINGNSTEYMDEKEFQNIIDKSGEVELSYMTKLNGENKNFTAKLMRRKDFAVYFFKWGASDRYELYRYWYRVRFQDRHNLPTMMTDEEVDFFEFSTFDYAYGSEEEQLEKKVLLNTFARRLEEKGLKRDTEKPDLYIYVTRDINRRIETVYHPTVTSNTRSSYSGSSISHSNAWVGSDFIFYNTSGHGQVNGQSTTVTEESGRIESYQTNDVYMQLSVLDAKKVGDKAVPKVWQFTVDWHFDKAFPEKEFENLAGKFGHNYPMGTDYEGAGIIDYGEIADAGLKVYPYSAEAKISYVVPNGWADGMCIKVNSKLKSKWYYTGEWGNVLKYGTYGLLHFSISDDYHEIKIDGKVKKNIDFPSENSKKYFFIEPKNLH